MITATRVPKQMERQQYTVTASELPQHLKRLKVPQGATIHYWYEIEPSAPQENTIQNIVNPQLKAFLNGIASSGGLTAEDVKIMKKHAQAFKENSPLSA